MFLGIFVISRVGILCLNHVLMRFAKKFPIIKSDDNYTVSKKDYLCIFTNMITETVFIQYIHDYYEKYPIVPLWVLHAGNAYFLFLTICSFTIILLRIFMISFIDDLLYSPYHYFLHKPYLFRYIHGIHHKLTNPSIGYIHAILEHPFEMIGALILHIIALRIVYHLMYIDQVSIYVHILIKACLACLNHSGHDVTINFLVYRSKFHSEHHKYRVVNYFQHLDIRSFW